jgi:small-conductance mechanosensitive channel
LRGVTKVVAMLALVLLVGGRAVAAADAPSEPAIVIKLPPAMTSAEVKQLVSELQAKGATLALPQPTTPPATEGALVWRITNHLRQAAPEAARFGELRNLWLQAVAREGRSSDENFWPLLGGLLAGALLVEFLIRAGLPILVPRLRITPEMPLFRAFGRHLVCVVLGVVGFLVVIRNGVGFLGDGSALLTGMGSRIADGAGNWRIAMAVLTVLAAPGIAAARPLRLDDKGAREATRWISVYLISAVVFVTGVWLVGQLGGDDMGVLAAFGMGITLLAYKIAMFLRLRSPVATAILAAGGTEPSRARRVAAATWHWFFIALSSLIFLLAFEEYAVGNNPRAGIAATALQTAIVAMSLVWAAKHRFILEYCQLTATRWWRPVLNRTVDVVVLLGGTVWLAQVWGYDVLAPESGGAAGAVLHALFKAVTTLAVAWLIWATIGGFLRERIPHQASLGDEDGAAPAAGVTRLATLLPLIRNTVAIAVFFLGAVIALGDLGVDIGPLLAGAGVVGIALGFGAQALVRDVIAGLFFLIDDAFRLGEYIDTGRLKGTVEAISIRSVRLRHQNGQVHTIPFGQIQAVTNSSRDWAIVKFNLHVAPGTDLELVRKTLKQLGLSLLQDPEIGGDFIQPLKMQGVSDVTQAAIMIRCKFTARPTRPSYLRRQALREIIARFAAAGIAFATPPVNASNPL